MADVADEALARKRAYSREWQREYRKTHKELLREQRKQRRLAKGDIINQQNRESWHRHKEATNQRRREDKEAKAANAKRKQEMRQADPEAYNAYMRDWSNRNRERTAGYMASWRANNPDYDQQRYPELRNRFRANQELLAGRPKPDKCEVCARPGSRIVFDHDHQRGHFRAWICHECNVVLGLVQDDPNILLMLVAYLKRSRVNTSPQGTLAGI